MEFAHLITVVARDFFGGSEEIPKYLVKDLSKILLSTVTKNNNEANRLVKKNRGRFAKISARTIISKTQDITSTQHLLALKIRRILVELIFSQQINSPDKLYPHVRKAVQVLQVAFSESPCVIGGEPINVGGEKDKFLVAPCCVGHANGEEYGSASACVYNPEGTTSYMNATIQCLHHVQELKSALIKWQPLFETSSDHLLTALTRYLFKQLDRSAEPVTPDMFFKLFEKKYPTLGQRDNHNPIDAQACWVQLLSTLSRSLNSPGFFSENHDIVDNLFNIKLVSRVHCWESGDKPRVEKSVCMLKWIVSPMVEHLQDGLRFFLERGFGKPSLCIGGLPRYLTIRFFHIIHGAGFMINLLEVDVYDLCSADLRANLEAARKGSSYGSGGSSKATSKGGSGQETQLTGFYDLVAFVAHNKNPNKNSIKTPGHYTAFIKPEKIEGRPFWFHYVDGSVVMRREKYVNQVLKGVNYGPYICLYKARVV